MPCGCQRTHRRGRRHRCPSPPRYDRLLRYAWLDFGDGEAYLINEAMVRAGYAAFATFPPDLKYVEEMREAGRFAREHGYGLWSGCQTDATGDTNDLPAGQGIVRDANASAAPAAQGGGCDPAYPGVCIAPPPPDLNCGDVPFRRFEVRPPDPHNFDGDFDGVGCERD
jgi:nuclease-like protein